MAKKLSSAGKTTKKSGGGSKKGSAGATNHQGQTKVKKGAAGKSSTRALPTSDKQNLKQQLKIQRALYEIADAASAVKDLGSFYKKLHKIVGRLMYAKSFYVILYDAERDVLGAEEEGYFADVFGDPTPPSGPLAKYEKTPSAHVIISGKTMHLPRAKMDELTGQGVIDPIGSQSVDWIGVPLKDKKKPFGVLVIQSYEEGVTYSEEDVKLLEFVGQHIATALTRVRAIEETRQRTAELAIINSVQEGLAKQLDFQGIIDLVGDKVGEIFKADTTNVTMVDVEREWISNVYYVDRGERIPIPDGPAPRPSLGAIIVDSHQPLLTGTREEAIKLGAVQRPRAGEDVDKNESFLGVPILTDDKVIGLINIQSYKQNAFNQDDLRLLQTLANAMSVALQNAQSFKAEQERVAELAIINSVQEGLASELDIQAIYELVGEKIREVFKADSNYIARYDHENQLVHPQYAVDRGLRLTFDEPFQMGQGFYTHVIRSRKPLIVNTFEHGAQLGGIPTPRPDTGEDLNESYLGVPLILGNEIKGIVSVQSYKQFAFDESDARLLTTLANSMSVALENARLFDETQRLLKETEERNAELAIVNSVQQGLVSKLDIQSICDLVGERFSEIFAEHGISLYLYDEETDIGTPMYVVENGERKYPSPLSPGGIGRMVMEQKKPLLLSTRAEFEAIGAITIPGTEPSKSGIFAPLVINEKVIGALNIENPDRENALTQSDLRLVTTIINSMSVALENARLFDETQQRNAELAVINSVQGALAAELDIQEIYDVVGEKLREIFDFQTVTIYSHVLESNAIHMNYGFEKGQKYPPMDVPLNSLYEHVLNLDSTFVRNGDFSEFTVDFKDYKPSQGEIPQSLLVTPVIRKKDSDNVVVIALM
ncbi:MAG: GAF domain-containing protein, partial [Anaerolineales bacterium]